MCMFSSYCNPRYKEAVSRALFQRAFTWSSDDLVVTAAFDRTFEILRKNGSLDSLLNRTSESFVVAKRQNTLTF